MRAVPPIHIVVENGTITLEGVVANEGERNLTRMAAKPVSGAFGVYQTMKNLARATTRTSFCAIFTAVVALCQLGPSTGQAAARFLTFEELVALSEPGPIAAPLNRKLGTLLNSPILQNDPNRSGVQSQRPSVDGVGPVLRVALWNIERGLQFELIRLAFSDPDEFWRAAAQLGATDPSNLATV